MVRSTARSSSSQRDLGVAYRTVWGTSPTSLGPGDRCHARDRVPYLGWADKEGLHEVAGDLHLLTHGEGQAPGPPPSGAPPQRPGLCRCPVLQARGCKPPSGP